VAPITVTSDRSTGFERTQYDWRELSHHKVPLMLRDYRALSGLLA
jgi:hypothetical protein